MVLYTVLKLLHGSLHSDPHDKFILENTVIYSIPTVNVDGLAYIEQNYTLNGELLEKRTNMNIVNETCGPV